MAGAERAMTRPPSKPRSWARAGLLLARARKREGGRARLLLVLSQKREEEKDKKEKPFYFLKAENLD
jgi:hypothetical protein